MLFVRKFLQNVFNYYSIKFNQTWFFHSFSCFCNRWTNKIQFSSLFLHVLHIVRLTMRHHLFLELWLVHTWFFTYWRYQRAITSLEKCTPVKYKKREKAGFPIVTLTPSLSRVSNVMDIMTQLLIFFQTTRWSNFVLEAFLIRLKDITSLNLLKVLATKV